MPGPSPLLPLEEDVRTLSASESFRFLPPPLSTGLPGGSSGAGGGGCSTTGSGGAGVVVVTSSSSSSSDMGERGGPTSKLPIELSGFLIGLELTTSMSASSSSSEDVVSEGTRPPLIRFCKKKFELRQKPNCWY